MKKLMLLMLAALCAGSASARHVAKDTTYTECGPAPICKKDISFTACAPAVRKRHVVDTFECPPGFESEMAE